MNTDAEKLQDWKPCDTGFLVAIAGRARFAKRRRIVLKAGAGVLLLVCAGGLGMWSTGRWATSQENHFGGIACHEVQENMAAFAAGTLPDELKGRIEVHLRECPMCREMMQKMQKTQAAATGAHDFWACDCLTCQRQRVPTRMLAQDLIRTKGTIAANSLPPQSLVTNP